MGQAWLRHGYTPTLPFSETTCTRCHMVMVRASYLRRWLWDHPEDRCILCQDDTRELRSVLDNLSDQDEDHSLPPVVHIPKNGSLPSLVVTLSDNDQHFSLT